MKCTQMCDQGRRCTCSDTDPARELIQQVTDLAGIISAVVMSALVIGLFITVAWVWL